MDTPDLPALLDSKDPAQLAFPPLMPMEIALKVDTLPNICRAYGYSREEFAVLAQHPVFIKAYQEAVEKLKVEGMSFRVKAAMQAEAYLETSYKMVQDEATSDNVRADLIKNTVKWAGLEPKPGAEAGTGQSFNIQINLG